MTTIIILPQFENSWFELSHAANHRNNCICCSACFFSFFFMSALCRRLHSVFFLFFFCFLFFFFLAFFINRHLGTKWHVLRCMVMICSAWQWHGLSNLPQGLMKKWATVFSSLSQIVQRWLEDLWFSCLLKALGKTGYNCWWFMSCNFMVEFSLVTVQVIRVFDAAGIFHDNLATIMDRPVTKVCSLMIYSKPWW